MVGGIVIVVVLVLFPLLVTTSTSLVAALIGKLLGDDAEARHEGSELLGTNY